MRAPRERAEMQVQMAARPCNSHSPVHAPPRHYASLKPHATKTPRPPALPLWRPLPSGSPHEVRQPPPPPPHTPAPGTLNHPAILDTALKINSLPLPALHPRSPLNMRLMPARPNISLPPPKKSPIPPFTPQAPSITPPLWTPPSKLLPPLHHLHARNVLHSNLLSFPQ